MPGCCRLMWVRARCGLAADRIWSVVAFYCDEYLIVSGKKERVLKNRLLALLDLGENEKEVRGLKHTPHEIFQQPGTWETTYQRCFDVRSELNAFLKKSGIGSRNAAPVVFLVGAGTSDYVGRALAPLLRSHWHCEAWAVPSTDQLTNMESFITPGREYLWISFSRSGDSSEGVAVLERALATYPQIRHLVITCNQAGDMARICSDNPEKACALVLDAAVNDRGLAMTSSFSNMVVAGHCLAHLDDLQPYGAILSGMIEVGTRFVHDAADRAAVMAEAGLTKACFVGTGALAAVASESALKLLELTAGRVHTMSESVLGLRHGPMSALDKSTLFTEYLSSDDRRRHYEMDLLREIREKQLGMVTTVVTPRLYEGLDSLADCVLSLDAPSTLLDEYRAPVDVILAQLLGLFASLNAGLQPDRPSPNGAINRVVSNITIY
jgi:tagatose-6-phosphate ketose/aldose isomerase